MDHSLVWLNENMSHAVQGHPRWMGHGGEFWHRGEGIGKPLPYSCLENPMDSMEEPKFSIYSLWHHLWRILEWSVMVFKGSHSVKKDTWILNVRKKKRKKNIRLMGKTAQSIWQNVPSEYVIHENLLLPVILGPSVCMMYADACEISDLMAASFNPPKYIMI